MISIERPSDRPARLGVTVSTSVGNAVVRNRVKRRIREFYRVTRASLQPADVVVIAKPGAGELESAETTAELRTAFGI